MKPCQDCGGDTELVEGTEWWCLKCMKGWVWYGGKLLGYWETIEGDSGQFTPSWEGCLDVDEEEPCRADDDVVVQVVPSYRDAVGDTFRIRRVGG
jgi:hypothetical protein